MTIEWVGQEDAWGCGFAAIAMLTGRSYQAVKAEAESRFVPGARRPSNGINFHDGFEFLSEAGYFWQQRYRYFFNNQVRDVWPPEPWAPLHLAEVVVSENSPGSHFVVMLADGSVLDPLTPEPRRLSDYFKTHHVMGLVRP